MGRWPRCWAPRALGIEQLIDPAPSQRRDLVYAMLVAQVIAPGSKLAFARGLRTETATSSLGEVLGVASCDEDDPCMRRWTGRSSTWRPSKTCWLHGI